MVCKSHLKLIFSLLLVLSISSIVVGQKSGDGVWRQVDDSNFKQRPIDQFVTPDGYKSFRVNKNILKAILKAAPQEYNTIGQISDVILTLPMPNGSFEKFAIKESPIMEPALAAKFPGIKTYIGQGIDNPTATTRFDFMPSGFHAIILSNQGTIYINPYSTKDTNNYISFNKASLVENPNPFFCEFGAKEVPMDFKTPEFKIYGDTPNLVTNGTTLRTYRLAVAATNEYAVAVGNNLVADTLAAQVIVMNRVNGIYERELSVRFNIIANNDLILYAGDNLSCGPGSNEACTAANDGYTNNNGTTMLGENAAKLNAVIGAPNFDIGHVFSTGGGGIAVFQSPCGNNKARGVTGLPTPLGDPFAIDYVSHEIGHQFGGNHTFNGTNDRCFIARNAATAYEPLSGSTIIAYAGICTPQNLQPHSDDYFHIISLEEIVSFINNPATGDSCGTDTLTGNSIPTVNVVGGPAFDIPQNTPFTLTASGTDLNGDALTYNWEQYDLGPRDLGGQTVNPMGTAAIFRSYPATASPSRIFPSLQYILNNDNLPPNGYPCGFINPCKIGEILPTIGRSMNFQVTVRDNRAGGGGVNSTTATVNVDGNSGPFKVTAQDSLLAPDWMTNTLETVTWNVANTDVAPVSAANVMILLSTDGGQTFPIVLAANTPNDGTEQIVVPNMQTMTARIKVQAVNNIFFDISNVDFTIANPLAAGASVSGRVVTSNGSGISRTLVKLTNGSSGETYSATTNQFGYFRFDDLSVSN